MRLKEGALLVAGPPCSLFVNACVSVHKRSDEHLLGDESVFKVRLANRIWLNFAPCPRSRPLLAPGHAVQCAGGGRPRGSLFSGTAGAKLGVQSPVDAGCHSASRDATRLSFFIFLSFSIIFGYFRLVVTTWMAFFGHDLHKPSHLLTTMAQGPQSCFVLFPSLSAE